MNVLRAELCFLLCLGSVFSSALFSSPLPKCEQIWSGEDPDHYNYDYQKDARFTEAGNLGYAEYAARTQRKHCRKDWDVLVFMAADAPDIWPYAFWDLEEMEAGHKSGKRYAGSTVKNDVLVELDTFHDKDQIRRLHLFQTEEVFQRKRDFDFYQKRSERDIRSPVVEFLPERGSEAVTDQGQRLHNFLRFAQENYPADHYVLVIWGHGQGWAGKQQGRPLIQSFSRSYMNKSLSDSSPSFEGGVAFDYSQRTYLDIPALAEVLGLFHQKNGKPLDILVNDACLMQMMEVATEVAPHTRYIVGTGQVQSFLGLPYRRILMELNSGQFHSMASTQTEDASPYLFAQKIPELYRKSYDPRRGLHGPFDPEAHKTMILSTLSTEALLNEGLSAINFFSTQVLSLLEADPFFKMDLLLVLQKTPSFLGSARDLGLFLGMLEQNLYQRLELDPLYLEHFPQARKLNEAILALLKVMDKVVISKIYGSSYQELWEREGLLVNYFKGLTVFLPEDGEEFLQRLPHFLPGDFYQLGAAQNEAQGLWPRWLESVFQLP